MRYRGCLAVMLLLTYCVLKEKAFKYRMPRLGRITPQICGFLLSLKCQVGK